jgi:imidazolonepropionase-like amidohydrolase
VLTLRAAGLLDIDSGEIVKPGILHIDDNRIVGVGARPNSPADDETMRSGVRIPGRCAPPALPTPK